MANQDILFPLLPRNTQVDVRDPNLRVKRIQRAAVSTAVQDDEDFNDTQEARTQAQLRQRIVREAREQQSGGQQPPADGENHASHQPPEDPAVAEDPRRKQSDHDDDTHKGIHLDTFV